MNIGELFGRLLALDEDELRDLTYECMEQSNHRAKLVYQLCTGMLMPWSDSEVEWRGDVEHARAVLRSAGYSEEDIAELIIDPDKQWGVGIPRDPENSGAEKF